MTAALSSAALLSITGNDKYELPNLRASEIRVAGLARCITDLKTPSLARSLILGQGMAMRDFRIAIDVSTLGMESMHLALVLLPVRLFHLHPDVGQLLKQARHTRNEDETLLESRYRRDGNDLASTTL